VLGAGRERSGPAEVEVAVRGWSSLRSFRSLRWTLRLVLVTRINDRSGRMFQVGHPRRAPRYRSALHWPKAVPTADCLGMECTAEAGRGAEKRKESRCSEHGTGATGAYTRARSKCAAGILCALSRLCGGLFAWSLL
jgi:hypothetical protein